MKSKLFHGLIATFVLIKVSIPDIAQAGNHQPQTRILSQIERLCIRKKLQQTEHSEYAQSVESDIYDNTILKNLAIYDEHRIAYVCLNPNNRLRLTEIQKAIPEEESQNNNYRERHRRTDNYAFFYDLNKIGIKQSSFNHALFPDLNQIRSGFIQIGREIYITFPKTLKEVDTKLPEIFERAE